MTSGESTGQDLRADVPTLEPDEVFLARLAALATGSVSRPPAGATARPGWRVGLAAASAAAVVAGVALLVGVLSGGEPEQPTPVPPASRPVTPNTSHDPESRSSPSAPETGGDGRSDDLTQESRGSRGSPDDTGTGAGRSPQQGGDGAAGDQGSGEEQGGEDRPGGDRGGSDDAREEHAADPGKPGHSPGAGNRGGGNGSGGGGNQKGSQEAPAVNGEAVGAR